MLWKKQRTLRIDTYKYETMNVSRESKDMHFDFLQEATCVGTVFIVSAMGVLSHGRHSPQVFMPDRGRDEYGPYIVVHSCCNNLNLTQSNGRYCTVSL
jgi:hypothetical protein